MEERHIYHDEEDGYDNNSISEGVKSERKGIPDDKFYWPPRHIWNPEDMCSIPGILQLLEVAP